MAQPNAAVTVQVGVELEPTQATPRVGSDEDFTFASTVSGYAAATSAFCTTVWNYIVAAGGNFHQLNYLIEIANVTGPEPAYQNQPQGLEVETRQTGTLGVSDVTSAATFKTALDAAIATAVTRTGY